MIPKTPTQVEEPLNTMRSFRPTKLVSTCALVSLLALSTSARAQLAPPPPLGGGGGTQNPSGPPPGADGTTPPAASPSGNPGGGNPGTPPGSDGTGAPANGGNNGSGGNGAPAAAPGETEQKLNEAEQKDSGRGFELLWARAEAGLSYMNLSSFSAENLGLKQEGNTGALLGIGAGLRLYILSVGVRFRHHQMKVNTEQLNLVVGLHVPISQVDLQLDVHGGYMFVGKLSGAALDLSTTAPAADPSSGVNARGLNAGLGFAVDYYIIPQVSVGAGFGADFLYLKRPPVEIPADTPEPLRTQLANDPLYQRSGESAGFGFNGGLRLGVHLDL